MQRVLFNTLRKWNDSSGQCERSFSERLLKKVSNEKEMLLIFFFALWAAC